MTAWRVRPTRILATLLVAVPLVATVPAGCDARPVDPDESFESIGLPRGGRPQALAVDGHFAYVAAGPRWVVLYVADPTQPIVLSETGLPAAAMAIDGHHLFTVGQDGAMRVFDVSEQSGTQVGRIELPFEPPTGTATSVPLESSAPSSSAGPARMNPRAIAVRDGLAYVAGELGSAEQTSTIEPAANGPAATATAIAAAAGGVVDRSGAASRLIVFDVRRPESPRLIGQVDFPGRAADIALDGGHAFVAASQGGLRVIDVADPARPRQVGHASSPASAVGVAVVDGHAFVAEDDPDGSGLQVIDARDPAQPVEIGGVTLARRFPSVPIAVRGIAAGDGRAWLATSDGVRVVDVAAPASPREIDAGDLSAGTHRPGSTMATAGTAAVALAGDRLYALDLTRGLEIFAPDEAGAWRAAGEWPALTRVTDVRALESPDRPNRLLVVSAGRPAVVDLEGSASMPGDVTREMVQPIDLPGRLDAFTLDGSRLYATVIVPPADPGSTVETLGLAVVDLDWPGAPLLRTVLPLTDYSFDRGSIAAIEDTVWLKLRDGAWLVADVVDSASARALGTVARDGRGEVLAVVDGQLIAVSNDPRSGEGRLEVLDVADPLHPATIGHVAIAPDPVAVATRDGLAYVAAREALQIVDLSEPSSPMLVGALPLSHPPHAMAVRDLPGDGREVLITSARHGLLEVDVTDPAAPRVVGEWLPPAGQPALGVAVAQRGDRVYVAGGDAGLEVLGAAPASD